MTYLFYTLRIFNSVNTNNHFVRGQGRAKSCKLDANSLKSAEHSPGQGGRAGRGLGRQM